MLSLRLFSQFQVELGGKALRKFRTNKVKGLLIYLATEQAFSDWPLEHQRKDLMALFWPKLSTQKAQINLRQVLYHLRRTIPWVGTDAGQKQPLVIADRRMIGVHPEADYDLDVSVFLTQIAESQYHPHQAKQSCANCLKRLEKAADLYRGDIFSDFSLPNNNPFEEWSSLRREQLRQKALSVLADLTAALLYRGYYQRAETTARRQLEIDRFRDKAHLQLMQAQACAGNRGDAMLTYWQYCDLLENELGLAPTSAVQDMADAIQNGTLEGQSAWEGTAGQVQAIS